MPPTSKGDDAEDRPAVLASIRCLRILQGALADVTTLIQDLLAEPEWADVLIRRTGVA